MDSTTNPEKTLDVWLPSLTSMRIFAALFVALHHVRGTWGHFPLIRWMGQIGWLGVTYFFILSGFVLMWSFNPVQAKTQFILRRLIRIYPLHALCLFLGLLIYLTFHQLLAGYSVGFWATVANLFLIQDWIPGRIEMRHAWNAPAWSLSAEFFFYLLAPFLFPLMLQPNWMKRQLRFLAVMWGALLSLCLVALQKHWSQMLDYLDYSPLLCLFPFALGASGALLLRSGWRFRSRGLAIAMTFVPIIVYSLLTPDTDDYRRNPAMIQLFIPGAFLLIMAVASGDIEGKKSWLCNPRLVLFGDASFAFYMIHALWLGFFYYSQKAYFALADETPFWGEIATLGYLATAIFAALAVHRWFEQPVRIWLTLKVAKLSAPSGVPASSA